MFLYKKYSDYLKEKYNEKVYKIPINLDFTCPNRQNGQEGCTFCGDFGTGYESASQNLSVKEQIKQNKVHISKKYKAKKFIAYFQNFTNTYMPLEEFEKYIIDAIDEDIVEIAISTRPDCINNEYLNFLYDFSKAHKVEISIELGLQTVNYHSLKKVNRGHSLAEFIDAVINIKKYNFPICTHIILNLPWDNMHDAIENAKILSALKVEQVKLHALYLVKGSIMEKQYLNNEFDLCSLSEYRKRVITFLEYLDPDIVIQRLLGRVPKEFSNYANWDRSWWRIRDEIEKMMIENNSYQGKKFDYLNGKHISQFFN